MSEQKLHVYYFLGGKTHASRRMHSRPFVGDIIILSDGDYKVKQVVWPYKDDNELDWLMCNCVITPIHEEQ